MLKDMMRLQMDTALMLTEAQTVIGLRVLGMTGMLPAAPDENLRMVTEKHSAFTEAGIAATEAMMKGQSPTQVYDAALKPIGRKTRANTKRLTGGAEAH
jgi:hypothetical protein